MTCTRFAMPGNDGFLSMPARTARCVQFRRHFPVVAEPRP